MIKKFSLLSVLLCGVSNFASADTLFDVLAYTYKNSLTITAERANLKATDETVSISKSGYRPRLSADGSYGRSYNKYDYDASVLNDSERHYQNPSDVSLNFVQPIFSGLSTVNSVKSAKMNVRAGRSNLLSTEQMTLLDATTVYMDVIRDKAVLELQVSNENILKKHLESYRKRFKVGELTRTDVAQSEARVSGATANRIAAEGNLKVSDARFFSVVGIEPNDLKDVETVPVRLPQTLDEALNLAMKNNPMIKAAEYIRKAANYSVSAKKGALLPSVNVTAGLGRQRENLTVEQSDYWRVTATVSVPLFQSGSEYAEVRQAKNLENRYRILWAKACQDVRSDTIAAWEQYQATKAQIESIKAQIKASKIALDGVIREAKVGSRTVLDVLDAEQEHLDNQVSLVKAHRDEIVAAFTLMSAIGQMNQASLNLNVKPYDPKAYYEDIKNQWFGYGVEG